MRARVRDWGGASGPAGRTRPRRAARAPRSFLIAGTAGTALIAGAIRCVGRALVALLVLSVLTTVSALVWPSVEVTPSEAVAGSPTAPSDLALGVSPLAAVPANTRGGSPI